MGAWGTGLYSDDTTCDVRDDYVNNLQHGLSAEESYRKILDQYGQLLEDRQISCLVYFALADTAWRYGRLDDALKSKALALLQSGGDIFAWKCGSPRDLSARRRVLKALESRLGSAQPVEKPVKVVPSKPKKVRTKASIGSVFSLKLPSGNLALLTLVGFHEFEKSIDPVFSVPYWRGTPGEPLPTLHDETPTVVFDISGKQYAHVAILPGDERKNLMMALTQMDVVITPPMPHLESTVWLSIGRMAKEIDAYFMKH